MSASNPSCWLPNRPGRFPIVYDQASSKRAQVPEEPFAKHPSALEKLTGASTPLEEATATQRGVKTVLQPHDNTVPQSSRQAEAATAAGKASNEKIGFYLRPDQVEKLDELALAYKKRTGIRLNRNELVRRLIDRVDLQLLEDRQKA